MSKAVIYANKKQQAFLAGSQKRKCFNGGRGSGKSTAIGMSCYMKMRSMPKGKGFIVGPTYAHLLNQTIPAVDEGLKIMQMREWNVKTKLGHYVVGKKPPAHFLSAHQEPRKYENVISFINGYRLVMLSEDVGDRNRGGSYDAGDVDESALISRDFVNKVCMPMIRGNVYRAFAQSPLHHSLYDYTSAPWTPQGKWIYETEALMKADPSKALFIESTALDNIAVLGEDYIDRQRAELSDLEFDVEIMNRRLKQLPNTFYPEFNDEQHNTLHTFDYDEGESGIYVKRLNDYSPTLPLMLSFDFNAAFNSCIVAQFIGGKLRVSNVFYNKHKKIDDLAETVAKHYSTHKAIIEIYGDRMGKNIAEATTNNTYYSIIQDVMRTHKLTTTVKAIYGNIEHKLKYFVVNAALSGKLPNAPQILINGNTCRSLILSIQNSPIKDDYQKDKKSETNKLILQETATHLSDAFDYLIYPLYAHTIAAQPAGSAGEVLLM